MIKLKHSYVAKKQQTLEKLDKHQAKVESLFKVYYDTLDEARESYIGQEYRLRQQMDKYEELIKGLMGNIKNYNYVEFYHEQFNLRKQIRDIKENLKQFNVYMPKYQLNIGDWDLAVNQIKVDVRERLNGFFTETDHSFALQNYEYVTKTLDNELVAKIYKQLGPFDFY